jgi:hypothetical protein
MHRLMRRAHILRAHSSGHRLHALPLPGQHQSFQIPLRRLVPVNVRQSGHDRLAVSLESTFNGDTHASPLALDEDTRIMP